ncbi:polyphosphate polymerase domain-containing protein [Actinomycetaceae bacterium L2_0104]
MTVTSHRTTQLSTSLGGYRVPSSKATELDLAALELAPISLTELNARASLQIRRDRKYILTTHEAARFLRWLTGADDARVLEIHGMRSCHYDSTYFDTGALDCYWMALQRNRHRFKVRIRTYHDSGQTFLEVKTKSASGHTVKNRIPWSQSAPPFDLDAVPPSGRGFIERCLAGGYSTSGAFSPEYCPAPNSSRHSSQVSGLAPSLETRYRRTTIHLPGPNIRLTLDQDLRWSTSDGSLASTSDRVIVETKSAGHSSYADRHLWAHGHRPLPSSKYATGIALLHPELPRERWSRTIGQHLQPAVAINTIASQDKDIS